MISGRTRAALSGVLLFAHSGCYAPQCSDGESDCFEVKFGRYVALFPNQTNDDGTVNLLMHFHGYGSSAAKVSNKSWLRKTAAERGYLLVLPDGRNNTWAHVGSPSDARDEPPFIDAVMDDVAERWAISDVRVVGGFSQGGSMAWDVACYRGDRFSSFIPASGAFWEPLPTACETPVPFRHTHGTADSVVPIEGRPIGNSMQGDARLGFDRWKTVNGCASEPDRIDEDGSLTCEVWTQCTSGLELQFCTHPGKHSVPDDFLPTALDWAERQVGHSTGTE